MLTMSGMPRFFVCPDSARLTQIGTATAEGKRGTSIHDAIEGGWLSGAPEVEGCTDMDRMRDWFPDWTFVDIEPKVAYDWRLGSGRIIDLPGARNYGPCAPTEIPGSADLVQISGKVLWLADIKTGYHQDKFAGRAADHWQLRGLALAFCGASDIEEVHAALFKVGTDGGVAIDECTWTLADLDSFAGALAQQMERSGICTSEWCNFCAAILSCPATIQAAALMRPVPLAPMPGADLIAALPPQAVAEALSAVRRLGKVGELLEARGRILAAQGNLPGFRLREYEVDVLDGPATYEYLSANAGRTAARAAVDIETSKVKIRAALKPYNFAAEDILRHLIEDQEARGLLTRRPVTRLEER